MTGDRSERNRELIEKSAALLAADYPFDALMERLSNAIAAAMGAIVWVALPNEDGTMRLSYVTHRGQRQETDERLMPEGSRVATTFHSGRPMMLRSAADWVGQEPYEVAVDGQTKPVRSALYVPVVYGDAVLGVLSVAHQNEHHFDRDDVRVIESLARHLAVAVRNQRSLQLAATPARYPWLLACAIAAVTLFTLLAGTLWAKERYRAVAAEHTAQRVERVNRAANALAEQFREDAQLAALAATVVGPVRENRPLAASLIVRLLEAREDRTLFGMGVFYEPNMFGEGLFGQYVETKGSRVIPSSQTYRYASMPWYRNAVAARGRILVVGPYREGPRSYISTVDAFYEGGRLAGVIAVDKLAGAVLASLRSYLRPNEYATVTSSDGRVLLSGGTVPNGETAITTAAVAPAGWMLHIVDSNAALRAAQRAILLTGILVDLAILAAGIFFFAALHNAARARHAAVGLKMQRAELQQEIATRIDAEERLRAAAYHDALTGLPNRTFFLDQLHDVISQRMQGGVEYAVLFIDLDGFHVINDSMGHSAGDRLLRAIAFRLQEVVPPHALVARLGGDEFVLLLPSQGPAVSEAVAIAEDILEALRNPFEIGEREVYSGASIGIVKIDGTYDAAETVLRDADISMYRAKRAGRAGYAIFDHAMRERITERTALEGELRGAIERDEIVAHYQPIVRLADDAIVGFEMLARWRRSGGAPVAAADFVEFAEQNGMLRAIDAHLFAQVCRDAVQMARDVPGISFNVNVSANDLTRASLLPDIQSMMELYDVPASLLRIEITETR